MTSSHMSIAEIRRILALPGTTITMVRNDWYPNNQLIGVEAPVNAVRSTFFHVRRSGGLSRCEFPRAGRWGWMAPDRWLIALDEDKPLVDGNIMIYRLKWEQPHG